MNNIESTIINSLIYFGPSTLRDIQTHLDMRGIVKSQNDIEEICQGLLNRGLIKEATGFTDIAYKI